MSRVGKQPIVLPDGVTFELKDGLVTIKGPKGELSQTFDSRININVEDNQIIVTRNSDEIADRSLHGLTRSLMANMVIGVHEGFKKVLQVVGIGYSVEATVNGLLFNLGFSHPILFDLPEGIKAVLAKPDAYEKADFREMQIKVALSGIDKQLLGQVAAKIRSLRKPEPYKGKGIRYEGEYVRRKAGKQVASVG